jgi:uncharacterized membrane protein
MNRSTISKALVAGAITIYMLLLGLISYLKYSYYGFSDFDLAVHAQSTWNILHGSIDSSILGIPFLGNHMTLILFLIAPFYAIFPSPLLLLHIQTAVLAMGALGIYLLARKELSEKWATCLAIAYLVYPPLIYMNLYEFHPVALASCFLIFMMYFYKIERFKTFVTFLILAILCQENISLIIIVFAAYAFLDKRRGRWVWAPLLFGTTYFVLTVIFIMPRLNNNTVQFWRLYANLGDSPANIVRNIIRHPLITIRIMTDPDKLAFVSSLLGPLGFLSVLNPLTLLPSLPILMQRLLSDRFTETKIMFHYQAEFIPFIFVSAIYGVRRMLTWRSKVTRLLPVIVLAIFPVSALISSDIPLRMKIAFNLLKTDGTAIKDRNMALDKIASEQPVAATFAFLPKLANRPGLYSIHHIYTGRYTLSTVPYRVPNDIQYAVIDTADGLTFRGGSFYGPEQYRNLQAMVSNDTWKVVSNVGTLLVLEKFPSVHGPATDIVRFVEPGTVMNTNVLHNHPASLELAGFNLDTQTQRDPALLTLFWRRLKPDPVEYDSYITIIADKVLYSGILSPGARIWPTQSWLDLTQTNAIIADEHCIHLYHPIADPGKLQIQATVFPIN